MKKVIVPVFAIVFLASCGGSCDLTNAKSAAQCWCEKEKAYKANKEDKSLKAERDKVEDEIEKNLEGGKYTEDELEKHIEEICQE